MNEPGIGEQVTKNDWQAHLLRIGGADQDATVEVRAMAAVVDLMNIYQLWLRGADEKLENLGGVEVERGELVRLVNSAQGMLATGRLALKLLRPAGVDDVAASTQALRDKVGEIKSKVGGERQGDWVEPIEIPQSRFAQTRYTVAEIIHNGTMQSVGSIAMRLDYVEAGIKKGKLNWEVEKKRLRQSLAEYFKELKQEVMMISKPEVLMEMNGEQIGQIVKETIDKTLLPGKYELVVEPGLGRVKYSDWWLRELVKNWVWNAKKAAKGSGGALVAVGIKEGRLEDGRSTLELVIRDFGRGFDKEILEKGFQPGVSYLEGEGMGMYPQRAFVESIGGEMRLRNHAGGGAEMVIALPWLTETLS